MFRRADQAVCAVCAALALAGCHSKAEPPDASQAPPSLSTQFLAPRGWTWSRLRLGDGAALRYGVASPPVAPHGAILILTNDDEPGEAWFETANDLMTRGYTVWILETGGAATAEGLDPAEGVLKRMVSDIIRPTLKAPLVVVAQGLGATIALAGLGEDQMRDVKAAMLDAPTLRSAGRPLGSAALWFSRAHLGWLPLFGAPEASSNRMLGLDPKRADLALVWRRGNPALRPGRTTFGWILARDRAVQAALNAHFESPTQVVISTPDSGGQAASICRHLQACRLWVMPTSAPHLAFDTMRQVWLQRIETLMEQPKG